VPGRLESGPLCAAGRTVCRVAGTHQQGGDVPPRGDGRGAGRLGRGPGGVGGLVGATVGCGEGLGWRRVRRGAALGVEVAWRWAPQ